MRKLAARALAVVLVSTGLLFVPSTADAVTPLWSITRVNGTAQAIVRNGGEQTVSANCPANQTPISGFVTSSVPSDDVRRLTESVDFGAAQDYTATLVNFTGAAGSITVQATVLCVPTSYFTSSVTASSTFQAGDDLIAEGTVFCPASYLALNGSISYPNPGDRTLLTSAPAVNGTAWEARGFRGSSSQSMTLTVRCVPAADIPGMKVYAHADPVGWGAGASVGCATGLVPITGGTVHSGGDIGAITINQTITSSGLTSTTLSLSTGVMLSTVLCVPGSNPSVSLSGPSGVTASNTATWTFSGSDPASAGGYTLTLWCSWSHPGGGTSPAPCTSPIQWNGLANGVHQFSVYAETSDGRKSSFIESRVITVDTVAPGVTFTDDPGVAHSTTSPTIQFQISDATTAVGSVQCWLDNAAPAACDLPPDLDYRGSNSLSLSGLGQGAHTLHVRPLDAAGNTATYDLAFTVDTVAPTVSMTKPATPFQLALSTTAAWAGQDATSGIAGYSVRSRSAAYNGAFGAWSAPSNVALATSKAFGSLVPGTTYCYATRAIDVAGNTSSFATDKCTAVPLDDRSMTRSKGWTQSKAKGWFKGTAVSTTTKGATLSKGATVKRIALVAQKCRSCGVVGVYVGKTLVGKISLRAAKNSRATITLPAFSLRKGTVKLKVLSSGKLVKIDAVGLSAM